MSHVFQNRPQLHSSTEWINWVNTELVQDATAAQVSIQAAQLQLEMREQAANRHLADAAIRQSCQETQAARASCEQTDKAKKVAEQVHTLAEDIEIAQLLTTSKIEQEFSRENPGSVDVHALMQELTQARIKMKNGTRRLLRDTASVSHSAVARLLQAKDAEIPV